MRYILLALAAFGVIGLATSAFADEQSGQSVLQGAAEAVAPIAEAAAEPQPLPAGEQAAVEAAPKQTHTHSQKTYRRPAKKQNMLQRLMNLERRKNAWLKKTFLGR